MIRIPQLIFGIGLNKTGTKALCSALSMLGLRVCHDWDATSEQVDRLRSGQKDVFLEADAWFDGTLAYHVELLAERFPDATFILTTRNKNDWLRSRIIHVLYNRVYETSDWQEIDTRAWSKEWDQHHEKVIDVLSQHRLVILDIPGGDGWEQLCPPLGLPIPHAPFPRINSSVDRLECILHRLKVRKSSAIRL